MVFLLVTLLAIWILEIGWSSWINSSVRYALHSAVAESMSDERFAPPINPSASVGYSSSTSSSSAGGSSSSSTTSSAGYAITGSNRVYNDYVDAVNDLDQRFKNNPIIQSLSNSLVFDSVTYSKVGENSLVGANIAALPPGMNINVRVKGKPVPQNTYSSVDAKGLTPREAAKRFPIETTVNYRLKTFFFGERKYSIKIPAFPRVAIPVGGGGGGSSSSSSSSGGGGDPTERCTHTVSYGGVAYGPTVGSPTTCQVTCYSYRVDSNNIIVSQPIFTLRNPVPMSAFSSFTDAGGNPALPPAECQDQCNADTSCNDQTLIDAALGGSRPASCYVGCREKSGGVLGACRYDAGDLKPLGACGCEDSRVATGDAIKNSSNCEVQLPGEPATCHRGCYYRDLNGSWQCNNTADFLTRIPASERVACDTAYEECSDKNASGSNIIENPSTSCLYNFLGGDTAQAGYPLCYQGCLFTKQDGTDGCKNFGSGNILDLSLPGCRESECPVDVNCAAGNGNACMVGCRLRSGICSTRVEDSFSNPNLRPSDNPSCFRYEKDLDCYGTRAELKYNNGTSALPINGITSNNVCMFGGSIVSIANGSGQTDPTGDWGKCYSQKIDPTFGEFNKNVRLFVDTRVTEDSWPDCLPQESCKKYRCEVNAGNASCEGIAAAELPAPNDCPNETTDTNNCTDNVCGFKKVGARSDNTTDYILTVDEFNAFVSGSGNSQYRNSWGCVNPLLDTPPAACNPNSCFSDSDCLSLTTIVDEANSSPYRPEDYPCISPVCVKTGGQTMGVCRFNSINPSRHTAAPANSPCQPISGSPASGVCESYRCNATGQCLNGADPALSSSSCNIAGFCDDPANYNQFLNQSITNVSQREADAKTKCQSCTQFSCLVTLMPVDPLTPEILPPNPGPENYDSECKPAVDTSRPECSGGTPAEYCRNIKKKCSSDLHCYFDGDGNMCEDQCYCDLTPEADGETYCRKSLAKNIITNEDCVPELYKNKNLECISYFCDQTLGCNKSINNSVCKSIDGGFCYGCDTRELVVDASTGDEGYNPTYGECIKLFDTCKDSTSPGMGGGGGSEPTCHDKMSGCVHSLPNPPFCKFQNSSCDYGNVREEDQVCDLPTHTFACVPANGTNYSCDVSRECVRIAETSVRGVGCFTPDTLIRLADGRYLPIREIKRGMKVAGISGEEGAEVSDVVVGPEKIEMYAVKVKDKAELRITEGHPLITREGPKRADKLVVGEELLLSDGSYAPIEGISKFTDPDMVVWNLTLKPRSEYKLKNQPKEWSSVLLDARGIASGDLSVQNSIK